MNRLLESALFYADLGYEVFPCQAGNKRPATPNGFKDATTDHQTIQEWWNVHPDLNIGIPTAGLLVVDVDGKNNTWMCNDPDRATELVAGAMNLTPSGVHYIFKQPPGKHYANTASKLAPHVDTRADGGYIIVPPSIVDSKRYAWAQTLELGQLQHLAEPPPWLMQLLEDRPLTIVPGDPESNTIPSGQRNDTLARLAGGMRRMGMGHPEILAALTQTNRLRCNPPIDDAEVSQISSSIARYEPDQVSVAVAEDHFGQMLDDDDDLDNAPEIPDPGPFPEELIGQAGGLIGEIVSYTNATSYKEQPVLAMAAAIALVATLIGRKVRDQYDTRSNIYCLGVCGSGGGKERARQVNKNILFEAGLGHLVGPEGLASHSGLVNSVVVEPSILFQFDEIGRMLRTLNNPGTAPHLYNIVTLLMKFYTSSNSVYLGDAYADIKRNVTIQQPNVVMYGTTVPQSFYESMTAESITDGFMARMLIFVSNNFDPEEKDGVIQPIPPSILDQVVQWSNDRPYGNLSKESPQPRLIEYTDGAKQVMTDLDKLARKERRNKSATMNVLWTRTREKARKLALIHACSVFGNEEGLKIDSSSAKWGSDFSEYMTRKMIFDAADWIADSPFEAKCKKVLRIVKHFVTQTRSKGIKKTEFWKKTRFLAPKERENILKSLLETKQLFVKKTITDGKPRSEYFLDRL